MAAVKLRQCDMISSRSTAEFQNLPRRIYLSTVLDDFSRYIPAGKHAFVYLQFVMPRFARV
jgi:hypothetical protein